MNEARVATLFGDTKGAALYVDFENLEISIREGGFPNPEQRTLDVVLAMQNLIRSKGIPCLVGRAYGSWNSATLASVKRTLHKKGISPQDVLSHYGKNGADMELALEASEALLLNPAVDLFVFFTGDRDFLPIARRIRERGKRVIFVGVPATTSVDLLNIVGEEYFIDYRELAEAEKPTVQEKPSPSPNPQLPLKEQVFDLLQARERVSGPEIWLGPFIHQCINALPGYTREDFENALDCLKEEGRITIEQKPDARRPGGTYRAIFLQRPNPAMRIALTKANITGS